MEENMNRNYILFPLNDNIKHLHCSTMFAIYNDKYIVDLWDINKDYHSLKPLQDEIKLLNKKEQNNWNKYGNKRILMDKIIFSMNLKY